MKLKLIFNPSAGRGKVLRHLARVEQCLSARAPDIDVHATSSAADLIRVAAESSRRDYDRIVLCGGDGTLNLAIREFDLSRGTLALIPLGSGDDFARVTGIPRDVEQACATVFDGEARQIDVAEANGIRYVGVAGLGFDSEVAALANQNVRFLRGSAVYLYAIFRVLPRFTPHRVRISVDGNATRDEQIMFAVVGNSRQYGGGIRIVPSAQIDDGILDFCIVHRTSRFQLLTTLPRAYSGTHVRKPFVETGRGMSMSFESEKSLEVFADGEPVTKTPVTFTMAEEKLRVIVPRR